MALLFFQNAPKAAGHEQSQTVRRGSAWMFLGFAVRLGIQALYFILLARFLGPQRYGSFVAVVAIVSILSPFSGVGGGNLLVKHVARDRAAFHQRWKATLIRTLVSGFGLIVLAACTLAVFRPDGISILLFLVVGVSDMVIVRLLDMCGFAYQATGAMHRVAQLQILPAVTRFLCTLVLVTLSSTASVMTWAWLYLLSGAIAAVVGLWWIRRELGLGVYRPELVLSEIGTGLHFSISLAAQSAYNDIDKAMLAPMTSTAVVGIYGAAYRIMDVTFAPIRAVLFTTYSKFFRAGSGGIGTTVRFARRMLPYFLLYSSAVAAIILLLAPALPFVLGSDFAASVSVLRWLAVLPVLKGIHYLGSDALTGADFQGVRSTIQLGVAVVNVTLNLVLIPAYSWRGAVWASLASDGLLAIAVWSAILVLLRTRGSQVVAGLSPSEV